MSIITDIQDAAVSSDVSLADLLRRVRVLAARLGNAEMIDWADRELNGYPDSSAVPDYRKTEARAYGSFSGPFGSSMNNTPIPAAVLPEKHRNWATTAYLGEPIRHYEELLKNPAEGSFQSPWPGNLILMVQQKVYRGMSLIAAWTEIPRGSVIGVVESVRNRVLSFALELEKVSPEFLSSDTIRPETKEKATQAFHTHIYGNVGNVAFASRGFEQHSEIAVQPADLESLLQALSGLNVPEEDIEQLKQAVTADGSGVRKAFGQRVSAWLGEMVSKAARGAWSVTLSTAANILPKLLAKYYGLPD